MKQLLTALILVAGSALVGQTTLINPAAGGGFEAGTTFPSNNWTAVNGTQTNKWFVGTAPTGYTGNRCVYISSNATGSNDNYNNGSASVVHFYQDITFPAGQPNVTLSFSWKGIGESCCDYLRVFLVPTTTTPAAGTQLPAGNQIGQNYNNQSAWQSVSMGLPCSVAGTTQRLVFSWRNDGSLGTNPAMAVDNISLVSSATAPSCASLLGTGVTNVASLPYASGAGTTCGAVNDLTTSNTVTCGSSLYFGGEDRVWVFTPTSSGSVTINLTSTGSYNGLALYEGCPISTLCSGVGTCIANAQSSAGNQSMCVSVTSGLTYYLVLDVFPSPTCNPYTNLTISAPTGTPAGTICSNAPAISLPYSATGHTTSCYGNDYTNASSGSCGTLYESGEDRVYALTVGSAQCINISLTNASSTSIGYQVYSGCPGSVGTTCIASNGGSNPLAGSVVLPAAGTYYIIVDSWSSPFSVNYDIAITSLGSGPSNDLPCSASALALNTNLSGDNSCSGAASEPGTPACWTSGAVNTVWYSVVAPASGQLRIRTTLGTLTNTQIALYSGTCGSLTLVSCNDDAPACGSSSYNNSEITATGLTAGTTYFIRVDGANSATGTFDIMAVDGAVGFPPAAGQDCTFPNPVCAASITVGNPGYQAYGNICDFTGASICLASGERGIAWYTIPINAAGNLEFDIVPNDYGNPNPITGQVNPWVSAYDETDYDFALWKISGSGSTNCAGIAAGAVPIRCNYSGLGVTGCNGAAGNAPAPYGAAFDLAYETQVPVVAGEVYVLAVSNFSNSTSGFSLVFSGGSPINYSGSGSSVTWTGGNNTNWTLSANWGGCAAPVCGIDAVIVPAAFNQPVLPAGNYFVRDLTINAGASLTLQAGAVLNVCGNFVNNGSLIAAPTSTIVFNNGSVNQSISGALVGTDRVGNLTITKTGGTVTLNSNIDIGGNFTTTNGTSVFNMNGRYMRVAGNFANNNGNATVTNTAGSTIEFNGTAAQTYNQGTSVLTLNNVLMNHTGPGVTCATNMVLGTAGVLTLTSGRLITNANEVQITNTAAAACSNGNVNSFVQGNLRRFTNGAVTTYEFPVGHATPGYQRATVAYTAANSNTSLLARFDTWATVPNGCVSNECPANNYNLLQAYNNGYWTVTAQNNPTTGTYNMTLWPTGYTNNVGAGWSIMKAPTIAGTWALDGVCAASTATQVNRTGLTGFSVFAVVQSATPLPVEFLFFNGESTPDRNKLFWATASETNNDYFVVERSADGVNFYEIGRVDGAGYSTQRRDYAFDDLNPISGIGYYRIKQVDFNGQSSYSDMITLTFQRGNMSVQAIRPNPTAGDVSIDFAATKDTEIHIVIMDVTGRIVVDEMRKVHEGVNVITMGITEGAGVYSIKITDNVYGFQHIERIVKY